MKQWRFLAHPKEHVSAALIWKCFLCCSIIACHRHWRCYSVNMWGWNGIQGHSQLFPLASASLCPVCAEMLQWLHCELGWKSDVKENLEKEGRSGCEGHQGNRMEMAGWWKEQQPRLWSGTAAGLEFCSGSQSTRVVVEKRKEGLPVGTRGSIYFCFLLTFLSCLVSQ